MTPTLLTSYGGKLDGFIGQNEAGGRSGELPNRRMLKLKNMT